VLILLYFAGATLMGVLFKGAPFCTYFCPLGQFSLVSSMVSPFEVKARRIETCDGCQSKDCIRGRYLPRSRDQKNNNEHSAMGAVPEGKKGPDLPGCELGLFMPRKIGNMNCHFRLDCLRACPYDNIGLQARVPGSELWDDRWRSGIGHLSQQRDLAALVALYAFGSLLNAFGMVSPVYTLQNRLAELLGLRAEWGLLAEAPVLVILFVVGLGIIPLTMLALAGWATRLGTGSSRSLMEVVNRYIFSLVPMGFGMWVAHFAFHFLTGVLTIIPVVQSTLSDLGWWSGVPSWHLGPILPMGWLYPVELGFLGLGWLGSLLVAYRIAEQDAPEKRWQAFVPWALVIVLMLAAAAWLMGQPMEMRGTFFE
jgi:hypothetical protein